jgi:hypothetical protein
MLPSQLLSLSREERAFIAASIETKIENDKKETVKVKKARKSRRR